MVTAAKIETVAQLNEVFRDASSVLVARNRGMTVPDFERLRSAARTDGLRVQVAKNRLAKIASDGTPYRGLSRFFEGQTVFIYTADLDADPVSASRTAVEFSKSTDKFEIVAVGLQNQVLESSEVKAFAKLPSLDELRARLIGQIKAPAAKIARVVASPIANVAYAINAYSRLPDEQRANIFRSGKSGDERRKTVETDSALLDDRPNLILSELLPSKIVRCLISGDVEQRIDGIRGAGKLIRSLERKDEMGSTKPLPGSEAFEASTLKSRLYNRLFSENEEEAREAAYQLVVSAPSLRGKLDPRRSLRELAVDEQDEFRAGLLKLFADAKLNYFSYVDATSQVGKKPDELSVHVTVRISRRVPFTIAERSLFLKGEGSVADELIIGSPLAEKVMETVVRRPDGEKDGVVTEGETEMTVRIGRLAGLKFPVVIGFGRCIETVDVDVLHGESAT